MTYLRRL